MQLTASQAFQTALQQHQAGRLQEAEASYRLALELNPNYAEALNNLGNVLYALGRAAEAEAQYRRTLELRPDAAVIHANLGKALAGIGQHEEAERSLRKALELQPDYAEAHNDLGKLLQQRGLLDAAECSYRRACLLKPELAAAQFNLGNLLFSFGLMDEAERSYRQALALDPGNVETHRNLVFMLNYVPGKHPAEIFAAHREFAHRFAPTIKVPPHANSPIPGRKLRVGYVSGDLRDHAVAFFIEPVLANHDRGAFEVFCYYNFPRPDAVTERLRSHADQWRDVIELNDESLAAMIRRDQIDILLDLSGHTIYNRLLMFSRKPAPVQATWLGYLNTTGLDAMDYRITDAHATPEGPLDGFHSEKLVRLPDSQWCYRPPDYCPDVSPPPNTANGRITFAAFANLSKIGEPTIELWSRLLARVPGSQLLVTSAILASVPDKYLERFVRHGIAAERVRILGFQQFRDYLTLHRSADVVLDTFPYSGGTTTCHALWMGVPVVTLAGESVTSRGGASLLHAVGLDEMVAQSPEQYLDIATALASDVRRLTTLRAEMRARMSASPLMDEARFTLNLEDAYRAMWRHWCANH
jgi:predicted O-linked N-acetylglucosamine transferase (SPINDLY family)